MPTFTEAFTARFTANLQSSYNTAPGTVSTAFATYINLANVFVGSTYVGKIVQFGRSVESAALAFATGGIS
jgi:hypothetical protein